MKVYENIVIGNFLYGLGLLIGAGSKGSVNNSCVNLLQQTPVDHALADVMVTGAAVFRLIEFKRIENQSHKETTKWQHLDAQLKLEKYKHFRPISLETHWYIEIDQSDGGISRSRPYLELKDRGGGKPFVDFISETARMALITEPNEARAKEFSEYLKTLAKIHKFSGTGSGAFVVCFNGASGLTYAPIENVIDFDEKHKVVIQKHMAHAIELEKQAEKIRVRQNGLSRVRSL